MIPRTFPSTFDGSNLQQMVVYILSDVTGLTEWIDYIPVKQPNSLGTANSYDINGYQKLDVLTSTTGKQAWIDYIPVYVKTSGAIPWSTDATGYIPSYPLDSDSLVNNIELENGDDLLLETGDFILLES